jgi:hypothetical protein
MKRLLVAALVASTLVSLTGCTGSASAVPTGAVAQAAPSGFAESDQIDGIPVKLQIEPFQVGSNTFVVTTSDAGIASVETQVVMLEMGHGQVLQMAQVAPGRYEATSPAIEMPGKWMLRVRLTTTTGEQKLATFYAKVAAHP